MFLSILNEILPIFLIILLGYSLVHFKLFNQSMSDLLVKLVFYVVLPPTLFIELARIKLSFSEYTIYMGSFGLSSIALILLTFLLSKFYFKREKGELIINLIASSHISAAYFAIPVFLQLFNDTTPVAAALIVQVFFTIAFLVGLEKSSQQLKTSILALIYKNPLIIGILLGLLCNVFAINLPHFINHSCLLIKNSASFLALLALGVSLAGKIFKPDSQEKYEMAFLIIGKSIIHPCLGYIIGRLFHLEGEELAMLVLTCSMPTANNLFIFASKYNVGTKKSSWIVFFTILTSMISTPLILWMEI